jgi:hypothetical protein
MSPPAKLYCIDTCSLIERNARGKYPHEVFPSLWERVDGLIRSGRLFSSEEVLSEIKKCTDTSDATHLWAVANSSIFLPIDDDVQNECLRIQGEFPRLVDPNGTKSQGDHSDGREVLLCGRHRGEAHPPAPAVHSPGYRENEGPPDETKDP